MMSHNKQTSEDAQLRQSISPLSLLKDDLNQFKDEVLRVFRDKDTKTQSTEKSINPFTLLKDDLSHLKDDLSSVFRIGRDNKDESSSNTFKIKAPKAERTDKRTNSLFRRDRSLLKTSQTPEDVQDVTRDKSNKSEDRDRDMSTQPGE